MRFAKFYKSLFGLLVAITMSACSGAPLSLASSEYSSGGEPSSIFSSSYSSSEYSSSERMSSPSSTHSHAASDEYFYDENTHWHYCTGCTERLDEELHQYDEEVVAPTYEEEGYSIFRCRTCRYYYRDKVTPALQHHFGEQWYIDELRGSHYRLCTDAGYEDLRGNEAPHEYDDYLINPTYTSEGYTEHVCHVCGYSYKDTYVNPLEHHYSSQWSIDAEQGTHYHACDDVGFEELREGEAPHVYDSSVHVPTYDEDGYTEFTCRVCGYSYQGDYVPRLDHHYSQEWSVDIDSGTHYHSCLDEGFEELRSSEAAHRYGDWTIIEESTLYERGLRSHSCLVCGYEEQVETLSISELSAQFMDFSLNETEDSYTVSSYAGETDVVVIPQEYMGLPVTRIGEYAFATNSKIETVLLPDTLLEIATSAFQGCNRLTAISFGANLRSIGAYAFAYSGITQIELPCGLHSLGIGAFLGCALERISLPFLGQSAESVGVIGYLFGDIDPLSHALSVPSSLESVTILEGCESLGDYAFFDCEYIGNINLPDSLISIGAHCFEGCASLLSFALPKNVVAIGDDAFYGCERLFEVINDSALPLEKGSSEYGYIAFYAESIVDGAEGSHMEIHEDFVALRDGDRLILLFWTGEQKRIEIPDSITDIASRAFYEMGGIVSVSVPASVRSIGDEAFMYCQSLTEIHLPEHIDDFGDSVFTCCYSLVSATLPSDMVNLPRDTFDNCPSLRFVYLPETLRSIGDEAFASCASLKELSLPSGVRVLGDRAFHNSGIVSLALPANLETIGYACFAGAKSLSSLLIPDSVTQIDALAFRGCTSLVHVSLPNHLETIAEFMFAECTNLETLVLPSSVTTIEENAFFYCSALRVIELPQNLQSIGQDAFRYCDRLVTVINHSSLPLELGSASYGQVSANALEILTDGSSSSALVQNDYLLFESERGTILCGYLGKQTDLVINLSISAVKAYAFARTNLKSIILPEGVVSIGDGAFMNSLDLEEVSVPDSLEEIGDGIFDMLGTFVVSKLKFHSYQGGRYIGNANNPYVIFYGVEERNCQRIEVAPGCRVIYDYAFRECSHLTSVLLPDTLKCIGSYAFAWCTNIQEITIPNSVLYIGEGIVYQCASLVTLSIPFIGRSIDELRVAGYLSHNEGGVLPSLRELSITGPVERLPDNMFARCSDIERVNLPNGLKHIGKGAFAGCENLSHIILPETLLSIGEQAFAYSGLQNIDVPSSVKTIGEYAFFSGISSLSLPFIGGSRDANQTMDYVLSPYGFYEEITITECLPIAERAFAGFFNLKHVTFLEGASSIGERAFVDCSSLESIDLSKCGGAWGESAFASCGALKTVVLPDDLTELPDRFFSACPIEEMNLPSSLKRIGDGAISGNRLTNIVFPSSLEYIGAYNFQGKSFASLALPSSLTHIGEHAFAECGIENLTILSSNIVIESEAFYRNPIINISAPASVFVHGWASNWFGQSLTYWPSTLSIHVTGGEKILEEAFHGMNILREITLCDGLSVIETNAFYGCAFLAEIELPDSLCRIESGAFAYCRSLLELHIPEAVSTINSGILTNCTNVRALTLPYLDGTLNDLFGIQYENDTRYFRLERLFIMNGDIGDRALYQWASLYKMKLGNISSIGEEAFYGCRNLRQIELPSSLQQIGDDAFYGCVLLLEIINKSPLNLELGSQSYGCIAEHARAIIVDASQTHLELLEQCYLYTDETGVYFAGCLSSVYDFVIPSNVTSILPYACAYAASLHNVTVGENVRSIGERAFYGSSINNILLPDGLIFLGEEAFGECANLIFNESRNLAYLGNASNPYVAAMRLTNPNIAVLVVEEGCKIIASRVLSNSNIQQVILPEGLIRIEAEAFAGCSLLEEVTIPSSVLHIGERAFVYCNNLKSLSLPFLGSDREHPLTLEYLLGENVGLLESITIEYVPYLPEKAFYMCFNLVHVTIGSELSVIPDYAFYECRKLQDGELIAHATSIGDYAFFNCRNLYRPVFSEGLTSIGDYAFCNARRFGLLELPSTLASIGEQAFSGAVIFGVINHSSLVIEAGSTNYGEVAYQAVAVASDRDGLIRAGLTENEDFYILNGRTLIGYVGLAKEVEVPFVIEIAYHAFDQCDTLEKVYLPDTIEQLPSKTSIGLPYSCFNQRDNGYYLGTKSNPIAYFLGVVDSSIVEITIPYGCRMLSDYALTSCRELTAVSLPDTVRIIGNECFLWCASLQSLTLPKDVFLVGEYALQGCTSLTSLILPFLGPDDRSPQGLSYYFFRPDHAPSIESICVLNGTMIPERAFQGFSSLKYFSLPSGFTSIGASAFEETGLSSIDLPSTLTYIGANAFANTSLTALSIPQSVTYIGPKAFQGTALKELEIPSMEQYVEGLDFVSYLGLEYRSKLSYLRLLEGWTSIPDGLFANMKIDTFVLPDSLLSIGNSAFASTRVYSITLGANLSLPDIGRVIRSLSYPTEIINKTSYSDEIIQMQVGPSQSYSHVLPFHETSHIRFDGDYVLFDYGDILQIVSYLGNGGEVVVPEGVTCIGPSAFAGTAISDVSLPDSVEEIHAYAFSHCTELTSVSLSDSLLRFDSTAFEECKSLLPSLTIGSLRFLGSKGNSLLILYDVQDKTLESATIPSACRFICQNVFADCENLLHVDFGTGLWGIGKGAFQNCAALTSVTLPESLSYIEARAFSGCYALTSYTAPFMGGSRLENTFLSYVFGASSWQYTGAGPQIMDYVCVYGKDAFFMENCISAYALIWSLDIRSSGGTIEFGAFKNCSIQTLTVPFIGLNKGTSEHLRYLFGADTVASISGGITSWLKKVTVLGSCSSIGDYAFYGCDFLTEIVLEEGINAIGSNAFEGCGALATISLPSTLHSLGSSAFLGCDALQWNDLDGVSYLGNAGCAHLVACGWSEEELSSISFSSTCILIADYAFAGSMSLTSVSFHNTALYIGEGAFLGCRNLSVVDYGEGVAFIGKDAFQNCNLGLN